MYQTVTWDIVGMPRQLSGLNGVVLTWARERAGLSLDEVGLKLRKDPNTIAQWEAGGEAPTYVQLEKLAYQIYKCPLAVFFFPTPPDEPDLLQSFRTLPGDELEKLSDDTLLAIRYTSAMQISLYELNDGINPVTNAIFRSGALSATSRVATAADKIRERLGVSLEEQKACSNTDSSLKMWRNAVQDAGVFVFKMSLKQREVSGFCLSDPEFPVIMLNNSNAFSRQIFTIIHELSHLLLGNNGVTKTDTSYIFHLDDDSKTIEVFCNKFASELLVPQADFEQYIGVDPNVEKLTSLAGIYGVSREVILRKFYNAGKVDRAYYNELTSKWVAQLENRSSASSNGGNYYRTKMAYLGDRYLRLAFGKYHSGACSLEQLADYLDIRPHNVQNLEDIVLGGAA